jgi:hypothetical protein
MRGGAQCIAPCKGERQEDDECGNADAPARRQRYGRAATIGSVVVEVGAGRGPSRLRMKKPLPVQGWKKPQGCADSALRYRMAWKTLRPGGCMRPSLMSSLARLVLTLLQ